MLNASDSARRCGDVIEVRIRLGSGIARRAPAPLLTLRLPLGATVEDLCTRLADDAPQLEPPLKSAVAIVGGVQVARDARLEHGEEVALLAPISGG